jgi:hypothetical protein
MPEPVISQRIADQMRRHRELQRKSGLTIAAYCKRENISPSSWWYWRKRLSSKKVFADHTAHAPVSFLQLPTQAPETQKIDLTQPNGSRITMPVSCDPVFMRRTIRMLAPLRPR